MPLTPWSAVRFEAVQPVGRTRPIVLNCEKVTGTGAARESFVVKAMGLPEVQDFSLCHEFLGCRLAMRLGLAAPAPALIEISSEFIAASAPDLSRRGLKLTPGLAVGTTLIPNLQTLPTPVLLDDLDVAGAARIYAFDLLVQNPDRKTTNPNCGRSNGQLIPYDYENAFSFRFALLKGDPSKLTELPSGLVRQHLFFESLRNREIDFDPLTDAFAAVADDELADLCATLPPSWQSMGAEIHTHLVSIRNNWLTFKTELHATLKLP